MMNQTSRQNRDVHEYTRSLMQENQDRLQELKVLYEQKQISETDYLSCRRSLLQAMSQLEQVHANVIQITSRREPGQQSNNRNLEERSEVK